MKKKNIPLLTPKFQTIFITLQKNPKANPNYGKDTAIEIGRRRRLKRNIYTT